MPRFFVPPDVLSQETACLDGDVATHCKVLRLKIGDAITLCDGLGHDGVAVISALSPQMVSVQLQSVAPSQSEPSHQVAIFMALSKGDKLEHVLQKATELGASQIVAFPSSRCVAKLEGKAIAKKVERWQKIVLSAAQQCGRGRIPLVLFCDSFSAALSRMGTFDLPILLYENEADFSLRQCLVGFSGTTVSLMSGPEGGFDAAEIAQALAAGLSVCTLGKRILRCETAPLCALSATMFALGELG